MRRFVSWNLAISVAAGLSGACSETAPTGPWVVYSGFDGPGKGMHVVLISGDEEYRSEEALPQLGKILAMRHGFTCTVLFAIDPVDGGINPEQSDNIPGLEALETADLMILFTRYRALPDDQMRYIVEYLDSGRPIMGLRTATHAFKYPDDTTSRYRQYDCQSREWEGGFGRQVLGETWVSHHGHHGVQSTRGVIAPDAAAHPIVRGCEDIWGPSDVYTVDLPPESDCVPLVYGQVLTGIAPADAPVEGDYVREVRGRTMVTRPNDPMMPVAWTKTYTGPSGNTAKVFTTTMGAATDLESEGFRRLLVNAAYWCVRLEDRIPSRADVAIVGTYTPTFFGFGDFRRGLRPSDFALSP